jgi:hypothetical protein
MDQAPTERQQSEWREVLDRLTREHAGDDVSIEVLTAEFGDGREAERMPLAYIEYDPKADEFIVAVGGLDSRYPVVLRHLIAHPKAVLLDSARPEVPVAVEVLGPDDSRTLISVHKRVQAGGSR